MILADKALSVANVAKLRILNESLEEIARDTTLQKLFNELTKLVLEASNLGGTEIAVHTKQFGVSVDKVGTLLTRLGYSITFSNSSNPVNERIFISWSKS